MAGMIGFNMHKEDLQLLIDADSTPERLYPSPLEMLWFELQ
jgi:hypothetical protein